MTNTTVNMQESPGQAPQALAGVFVCDEVKAASVRTHTPSKLWWRGRLLDDPRVGAGAPKLELRAGALSLQAQASSIAMGLPEDLRSWLVALSHHATKRPQGRPGAVAALGEVRAGENAASEPQGAAPAGWSAHPDGGWRWRDRAEPSSTSVHTVAISRQIPVTVRDSRRAAALDTLVEYAGASAAWREQKARVLDARAREAKTTAGRRWYRSRAKGMRARWLAVAECGTRASWQASCVGCSTQVKAVPLRCGLPRECATCRGTELGARHERARAIVAEAERALSAEMARHGPTVAHPLGRWSWKLISLTIPPGAGAFRDGHEIRGAWARTTRKLNEYLAREGGESSKVAVLSSVEITQGVDRDGHVHLHAVVLAPYLPHGLLRRWWGDALKSGREMPYLDVGDALPKFARPGGSLDASAVRVALWTRRGAAGRPMLAVPWPVIDVRGVTSTADAITEVCKYAVKGSDVGEGASAFATVECLAALDGVRLFASSRWLSVATIPAMLLRSCECCGLVGEWLCSVSKARGPPEGSISTHAPSVLGSVPAN